MTEIKNIIFNKFGSSAKYLFQDLIDREDTIDIDVNVPNSNKIVNFIRMVHTSQTIRRVVDIPGQSLWFDMRQLDKYAKNGVNFIFVNEALAFINMEVLNRMKKRYPASRFVLIMLDSMHANVRNLVTGRKLIKNFNWDLVLSFDSLDCQEFRFHPLEYKYFSTPKNMPENTKATRNLVYIGGAQPNDDRIDRLRNLHKYLQGSNISTRFVVTNMEDANDGIEYKKNSIPYDKYLEVLAQANVILEVLKPGQYDNTARYFEAIILNKKLLTNNPHYYRLPYYDPRWIRYFSKPEDISLKWLTEEDNVDYGYDGVSFSPNGIPDLIERYIGQSPSIQNTPIRVEV